MSFHSLDYVAFFALVVGVYWMLDHRNQNRLLLVASYVFYGWVHPWFLTLIFASTVVDYFVGLRMQSDPQNKKRVFWMSLAVNLGLLGFFKYFNFFIENVRAVLVAMGLPPAVGLLEVVLPVGISFYTFQSLTYTIDVYRGTLQARRNFVDFALFVCFFPQLVAGPIERAERLLPKIEQPRTFSPDRARTATVLIVWGFFKKLVIADNVGVIANKIFALENPDFYLLWTGVFAFAIEIYADFSAYSDIARGSAQWLGIDLMVTFRHPYFARSPRDFWRRWHNSLSSWFRDYVYIPLGGSRMGAWGHTRNVILTFLLSGFWHGASWNYILWGLYHGVLLAITRPLHWLEAERRGWRSLITAAQMLVMFGITNIGWLLFRETDLSYLVKWFTLSPVGVPVGDRNTAFYLLSVAGLYSLPLWAHSLYAFNRERVRGWVQGWSRDETWARAGAQAAAVAGMTALILVLRSRTSLDFIYFQF
ncbi:MAG: MBOAT family protein [Vicinamibacterales bacterium]